MANHTHSSRLGFADHITNDHNMWQYIYFFVYLDAKSKDEYVGMETFVSDALDADDLSFFPINRSLVLVSEG